MTWFLVSKSKEWLIGIAILTEFLTDRTLLDATDFRHDGLDFEVSFKRNFEDRFEMFAVFGHATGRWCKFELKPCVCSLLTCWSVPRA